MRLAEGAPAPCARAVAVVSSVAALLALLLALWVDTATRVSERRFGGRLSGLVTTSRSALWVHFEPVRARRLLKLEADLGKLDETGLDARGV